MITRTQQLLLASLVVLPACGASPRYASPSSSPVAHRDVPGDAREEAYHYESDRMLAVPASLTVSSKTLDVATATGGASGATGPQVVSEAPPPKQGEMLDIEANVTIEVDKVSESAVKLRELVKAHGGTLIGDTVNDGKSYTSGTFNIRIPTERTDDFLKGLEGLGHISSRHVSARDIGKQYHDAGIQLRNLEVAMKRYEEILEKAKDVTEILKVEAELTRVRGQIEHVKGELRFMKDRASRSTIHVSLTSERPESEPFHAQAKLYPGLRFTYLDDLRGERGSFGFVGLGLSFAASRAFSIDLDAMRKVGSGSLTNGVDFFVITTGGEFYSDFLGGGRRSYLNPYLGFRMGYARREGFNEFAAGATLGLEVVRTKALLVDAQVRMLGFFGLEMAHVGVQPTLGFNVAF